MNRECRLASGFNHGFYAFYVIQIIKKQRLYLYDCRLFFSNFCSSLLIQCGKLFRGFFLRGPEALHFLFYVRAFPVSQDLILHMDIDASDCNALIYRATSSNDHCAPCFFSVMIVSPGTTSLPGSGVISSYASLLQITIGITVLNPSSAIA